MIPLLQAEKAQHQENNILAVFFCTRKSRVARCNKTLIFLCVKTIIYWLSVPHSSCKIECCMLHMLHTVNKKSEAGLDV